MNQDLQRKIDTLVTNTSNPTPAQCPPSDSSFVDHINQSAISAPAPKRPRKKIADPRGVQSALDTFETRQPSPAAGAKTPNYSFIPNEQLRVTLSNLSPLGQTFVHKTQKSVHPVEETFREKSEPWRQVTPSDPSKDTGRRTYMSTTSTYKLQGHIDTVSEIDAQVAAKLSKFKDFFNDPEHLSQLSEGTRQLILRGSPTRTRSVQLVSSDNPKPQKLTEEEKAKIREMVKQRVREKKEKKRSEKLEE